MEGLPTHSKKYEKEYKAERKEYYRNEPKPVVKSSPVGAFNIDNILGIRNEKPKEEIPSNSPETSEVREEILENQIRPSRNRKNFSKEQRRQLEKLFEDSHYPDAFTREELAKKLGISQSRVQIWFQNRRAKIRRQHDHAHHKQQEIPHMEHHYQQSLLRMMGYPLHQYQQMGHSPTYPHLHPSIPHPQTSLEQYYEHYWRSQQSHHPNSCDWRSRAQYPRYDHSGHQ